MKNKIKITKDLNFGYEDLMREVDFSHQFCLHDILSACIYSRIDVDLLKMIFRCPYIVDYWKESTEKAHTEKQMEYLEVYWWGTKDTYEGVTESGNCWGFHGKGKKGVMSKDLLKYHKWTKEEKANYVERYAIEMTPIYKLAYLPIRMAENILISDYDNINPKDMNDGLIKFTPSITLIELFYAIFQELSFHGSIEKRENFKKDLIGRCKELDKSISKKSYSNSTKVMKNLRKKYNLKARR